MNTVLGISRRPADLDLRQPDQDCQNKYATVIKGNYSLEQRLESKKGKKIK